MTSHDSRGFFPQEGPLDLANTIESESLRAPTPPASEPAFADADLGEAPYKLPAGCDDPGFRTSVPAPQPVVPSAVEVVSPNRLGRESTGG